MSFLSPENSLSVIRGTSFKVSYVLKDPDGAVLDLTGAKVYFTIKDVATDPVPLVQKTSDAPTQVEVTAPREGKVTVYLDPIDTHDLDIKDYVFDVWVVLPTGKRYIVVGPSTLELHPGVTVIPV